MDATTALEKFSCEVGSRFANLTREVLHFAQRLFDDNNSNSLKVKRDKILVVPKKKPKVSLFILDLSWQTNTSGTGILWESFPSSTKHKKLFKAYG